MKRQVRDNFDLSVDGYLAYEADTGRFAGLARRLRDALAERGATFDRVLDLGAGTGASTAVFAEAGPVVALDASRGMLAANAVPDRVLGDLERLPVADGRFDVVAFAASLFAVPDPAAAAREARRVVREDGLVGATVPAGWYSGGRDVFDGLPRESRSPRTVDDVRAALEAAFDLDGGRWSVPSSPAAVRAFHAMPAGAARLYPHLPPDERRREAMSLLAGLEDRLDGPVEQRWHWFVGRPR